MKKDLTPIHRGPDGVEIDALDYLLRHYFNAGEMDRVQRVLTTDGKAAAVEVLCRELGERSLVGSCGPNMPRVRTWCGFVEWFPPTWDVGTEPTYRISCKELARIKVEEILPERQLALFPVT